MEKLFEIKDVDRVFYEEKLKDFLPEKMIDIHTHIWLSNLLKSKRGENKRTVSWPSMVAAENPVEDLLETYRLMFPGKQVTPLVFSTLPGPDGFENVNEYVSKSASENSLPSLIFSDPSWPAAEFEKKILDGGFLGAKSYLSAAPAYLPTGEIRIFDYFPHHQLEVMNNRGWIMMLHIPRDQRLRDPVNIAQMIEIDEKYPKIRTVIAHVGRAYCNEDVGNAFDELSKTENLLFDFSANCNQWVFEQAIKALGPKRLLFGSDMPILRMRTRRICEDGFYVNLVPKGLYGDVSRDAHMREIEGKEAEALTFFMYEELDAFRKAAESTGLSRNDIEDIFYNNAAAVIESGRAGSTDKPQQLQMMWPVDQSTDILRLDPPEGYEVRTFRPGDEAAYIELMHKGGFETWGEQTLKTTLRDALPDGVFFIVHKASGKLVATACAQHYPTALQFAGGQLGWVSADPEHRGKGLGGIVCAHVIKRFLDAGYKRIFLLTDDFRLPAVKTYLKQGWAPFIWQEGMKQRWKDVCEKLNMDVAAVDKTSICVMP